MQELYQNLYSFSKNLILFEIRDNNLRLLDTLDKLQLRDIH